jgi:hypothetical protein
MSILEAFDEEVPRRARSAGMARATTPSWHDMAFEFLWVHLPWNEDFLPEEWRSAVIQAAGDAKACWWGTLTSRLIKRGVIERTGERRKMNGPKSNQRKTDVYRRAQ